MRYTHIVGDEKKAKKINKKSLAICDVYVYKCERSPELLKWIFLGLKFRIAVKVKKA